MAADILTVAEARAVGAGAVVGELFFPAIVENKGGAGGMAGEPCLGGGTFVAEFSIARIDCWPTFVDFVTARGAAGRPRAHRADRGRERDRVRAGIGPCWLALTSSLVASSLAAMLPKLLGYTP